MWNHVVLIVISVLLVGCNEGESQLPTGVESVQSTPGPISDDLENAVGRTDDELIDENLPVVNSSQASDADFELCNRCYVAISNEYLYDDVDELPEAHRVVLLTWHAVGIVGNGGFEYLLSYDTPGDPNLSYTVDAFDQIGSEAASAALRSVIALFPDGQIIEDVEERMRFYNSVSQDQRDELNQTFWKASDIGRGEITIGLASYIRQHISEFVLEDVDPATLLTTE